MLCLLQRMLAGRPAASGPLWHTRPLPTLSHLSSLHSRAAAAAAPAATLQAASSYVPQRSSWHSLAAAAAPVTALQVASARPPQRSLSQPYWLQPIAANPRGARQLSTTSFAVGAAPAPAAAAAAAAAQPLQQQHLQPPTEPDPEECCGRGCTECVWTVYYEELKQYQAELAAQQGQQAPEDPFAAMERRLAEQQAQQQQQQQQAQQQAAPSESPD